MWNIKTLGCSLFVIIFFQGCGYAGQSAPEEFMLSLNSYSETPSYQELYDTIFRSKCLDCHNSGPVNFSSYDLLIGGGSVVAFNPDGSSLYQQVITDQMPMGGLLLSVSEKEAILNWIQGGATRTTIH